MRYLITRIVAMDLNFLYAKNYPERKFFSPGNNTTPFMGDYLHLMII